MGVAHPYPLLFKPILFEKVWGGRRLERLGKTLPHGALIGESWELADMPRTSASGAGGGPTRSRILNGPLAGATLHDALAEWGKDLLPRARNVPDFPLLLKFLDARENLSVQVHPTAEYAARHPGLSSKFECWYVVDAEPGALIYKGLRPGTDPRQLAQGARDGTITRFLDSIPAFPGMCHALPAGTVHALGAGVLAAEVQTPGDTTFRIFDWGRSGREVHLDAALTCASFAPTPVATHSLPGAERTRLADTPAFTLDELRPVGGGAALPAACAAVIIVSGRGRLVSGADLFPPLELPLGSTALVPVAVAATAVLMDVGGLVALLATPRGA
jgi:mannose-6-phosphate isomerase